MTLVVCIAYYSQSSDRLGPPFRSESTSSNAIREGVQSEQLHIHLQRVVPFVVKSLSWLSPYYAKVSVLAF